jgi:DNA topoisomerase IA
MKILCVAEKPSIAKAVANSLSNGSYNVVCFASLGTSNHRHLLTFFFLSRPAQFQQSIHQKL